MLRKFIVLFALISVVVCYRLVGYIDDDPVDVFYVDSNNYIDGEILYLRNYNEEYSSIKLRVLMIKYDYIKVFDHEWEYKYTITLGFEPVVAPEIVIDDISHECWWDGHEWICPMVDNKPNECWWDGHEWICPMVDNKPDECWWDGHEWICPMVDNKPNECWWDGNEWICPMVDEKFYYWDGFEWISDEYARDDEYYCYWKDSQWVCTSQEYCDGNYCCYDNFLKKYYSCPSNMCCNVDNNYYGCMNSTHCS